MFTSIVSKGPHPKLGTMPLQQYGMVRVRKLLKPPNEYDGWRLNRRPPSLGDVGCIVEILQAPGLPDSYIVESSGADGVTIWLGDFCEDELEPLEPDSRGDGSDDRISPGSQGQ